MRRLLKMPLAYIVMICVAATIAIGVRAGDYAPLSGTLAQGRGAEGDDDSPSASHTPDAGVNAPVDAGLPAEAKSPVEAVGSVEKNGGSEEGIEKRDEEAEKPVSWRKDPSVKRRPGSYLGGGMAYTLANAWYHVKLRDYEGDYHVGPLHGTGTFVRVGDAFFDWFAVGFHLLLISANNMGQSGDQGISGFALFLDPTFYPWRGLGLRPSVGLGFSYAQAGRGSHELGFGGPATLAFAVSYEFRVSRLFVMGPVAQICWTTGKDFDGAFFSIGLQMLKWFMTPEG